jgi:recombination protein RecA
MIALAQKEGKICAWIDAESSYDQEWATSLGVDSENLIYSPAKTINHMVDVAAQLMKQGVDIIVVDSISALLPAIYFDDNELKQLENTKQIGAEAKDMTHAVKMLNYSNEKTLLVLISQQRNQFGSMHASHIPTGGMATKFFSSTVIKLWSSEAEANQIKADVKVGDKLIQQKVGRPVNWIIDYNKLGPPNLTGQYDFYYRGPLVGIDHIAETLDMAEQYGVIEKGGAWYTILDQRFQGRAKAIEWLRENPEACANLIKEVYEKS